MCGFVLRSLASDCGVRKMFEVLLDVCFLLVSAYETVIIFDVCNGYSCRLKCDSSTYMTGTVKKINILNKWKRICVLFTIPHSFKINEIQL